MPLPLLVAWQEPVQPVRQPQPPPLLGLLRARRGPLAGVHHLRLPYVLLTVKPPAAVTRLG